MGGEKESTTIRKVNIYPDVSGRTLLAWYGLQVIPYFMPVDTMPLYVTCRQGRRVPEAFSVTSEERKTARYLRRVAARQKKKAENCSQYDDFNTVFSYENLYDAYKCCRKGVAWKASVQKYITQAPLNLLHTYNQLQSGKFKSPGFYEFDIFERGKHRHIRSTVIGERVVQRCLCDNALVPMLYRTFVYDNGASMKYKGYDFAVRRLTQHLHKHYRKHGQDGYILLFDFSKFFDNVSHAVIKNTLRSQFSDEKILRLTEHFVDAFGDVGMGLGSQISQVLALASANRLDHYVKEVLRIKGYGRYMDDGYLIHESKEYLQNCLVHIQEICNMLGITLNAKKTQIVKLSHGFTWLKIRFYLTDTGRVVRKIYKRSVTRMRVKMKKLHKMWKDKRIAFSDIYTSWQSWKAYALKFDAYYTIQNMAALYNKLFLNEWEERDYALP